MFLCWFNHLDGFNCTRLLNLKMKDEVCFSLETFIMTLFVVNFSKKKIHYLLFCFMWQLE